MAAWRTWWQSRNVGERTALTLALVVIVLAAVWWTLLAPALRTLREAPLQQGRLDGQLQRMRLLQQEARALQAMPRLSPAETRRQIEAATATLGSGAVLSGQGERLQINLKNVPAASLAPWFAQVRLNAQAVPTEAHLLRNAAGGWDGVIVLQVRAS